MDLALKGKTVLITGGSRGIGFGCAEVFAQEGANLHLVSVNEERLTEAKRILDMTYHVDVRITVADLSKSEAIAQVAEACPMPDILINNAGAIPAGTLDKVTEAVWREAWDLKVFGYINMTRDYYGRFRNRGYGTIVNVIGMAGENPDSSYVAGSAGNAAIMAFTKTMGGTSMNDGIRIVGVNPGAVLTDRIFTMLRTIAEEQKGDPEKWPDYLANLPMGRAATVRETADVVAFLASERAGYISGTIVTVDGGHASNNSVF
ncbi:MAG: short-chain dehydrogenase/reductase [Minwuia sp.]|uniref:short-chain dehydrogenase/reductase n=1 Tax=Minwuia sp. TaxID=2493630 RepID=UPI003A88758F